MKAALILASTVLCLGLAASSQAQDPFVSAFRTGEFLRVAALSASGEPLPTLLPMC